EQELREVGRDLDLREVHPEIFVGRRLPTTLAASEEPFTDEGHQDLRNKERVPMTSLEELVDQMGRGGGKSRHGGHIVLEFIFIEGRNLPVLVIFLGFQLLVAGREGQE